MVDIFSVGIGNLLDADLADESANLQSLQIKQQLGVQALSIANSGPQSILSLSGPANSNLVSTGYDPERTYQVDEIEVGEPASKQRRSMNNMTMSEGNWVGL